MDQVRQLALWRWAGLLVGRQEAQDILGALTRPPGRESAPGVLTVEHSNWKPFAVDMSSCSTSRCFSRRQTGGEEELGV